MTALEFEASLGPDGMLKVPQELAAQLRSVSSFRVLVLVPGDSETAEEEDEAWRRLGLEQFVKGYADSDSIYDDL